MVRGHHGQQGVLNAGLKGIRLGAKSLPQIKVSLSFFLGNAVGRNFIRKFSNKQITVISAENDYFFSRTALMYVYMGHLKWNHLKPYEDNFWQKNRINLNEEVIKFISKKKGEPKWLTEWRLKAYKIWLKMKERGKIDEGS